MSERVNGIRAMTDAEIAELRTVVLDTRIPRLLATINKVECDRDYERRDATRMREQRDDARAKLERIRGLYVFACIAAATGWLAALYMLAVRVAQ